MFLFLSVLYLFFCSCQSLGTFPLSRGVERPEQHQALPLSWPWSPVIRFFSARTAGWALCGGKPGVHQLRHLPALVWQLPGTSLSSATSAIRGENLGDRKQTHHTPRKAIPSLCPVDGESCQCTKNRGGRKARGRRVKDTLHPTLPGYKFGKYSLWAFLLA